MYLDDIPINPLGVFFAALAYFIIGWLWYAPFLFGNEWGRHDEMLEGTLERGISLRKIGAYIGEFIISLIIAYVFAIFLQISQANEMIEGITVAFWAWIGFIATTHFSAVLWGRKTLKHFLIHAGFMLVGLLVMGAILAY